jgi:capsular exopolysaccharide synthesis family protein
MFFFRWKIVVFCFVYSLLAGVLYIHMKPEKYQADCRLMAFRDPNTFTSPNANPFYQYEEHRHLLGSVKLQKKVVDKLKETWLPILGNEEDLKLSVSVLKGLSLGPTLDISVSCRNREYGKAYLDTLIEEYQTEWQSMRMENADNSVKLLEKELVLLEEKLKSAEDAVVEYQRLHDLPRVSAKGADERAYLLSLVNSRRALSTELMMLDYQFPRLKNESADVIASASSLSRDVAESAMQAAKRAESTVDRTEKSVQKDETMADEAAVEMEKKTVRQSPEVDAGRTTVALRVSLRKLEDERRTLMEKFKPEHPEVVSVERKIKEIQDQMAVEGQTQLEQLRERHRLLTLQMEAIEAAEYQWQAKNMWVAQRQTELMRLQGVVTRFKENYETLYSKLHDLKVAEELKVEYFNVITPVTVSDRPVWPDPMKVLLVALVVGLGGGFGLAILAQIFDNKVQSIKDVEKDLGVPFLGGVPFWVHSGLEKSIRPIVTEEHSTGAVEAYRALRTMIISSLAKMNEKIFFVVSADSREGKTLTALNVAIMMAQMGKKVLLVDLDLRRGRLHRSLGAEREPGVNDVLKGEVDLRQTIVSTRIDNLSFIPSGSSIEDSAEYLQSSDLMHRIKTLQEDFDYICVDTAPVLRVTDTVIATTQGVGVVIYVARVNHTPKPLIKYSLEMLKDSRVIGLIMNSIEMHKISSLYYAYQYPNYAYYSNAYAYGYNYYYYNEASGDHKQRQIKNYPRRGGGGFSSWFRKTFLPSG